MDDYMFLCHFHLEKTPSMAVGNIRCNNYNSIGLFFCFGCGEKGKISEYIGKKYELNFIESLQFLASVFKMPLPNNPFENNKNAEKIFEIYISKEYENLIIRRHKRNLIRGFYNEKDLFDKDMEHIDNLRKGNYDKDFKYINPKTAKYILT